MTFHKQATPTQYWGDHLQIGGPPVASGMASRSEDLLQGTPGLPGPMASPRPADSMRMVQEANGTAVLCEIH